VVDSWAAWRRPHCMSSSGLPLGVMVIGKPLTRHRSMTDSI